MAGLTAKTRERMSPSKFALVSDGKKSFPVEDKKHARLALSGATRSENAGNITPEQAARIRHRANQVLGQHDSSYHNK